MNQRSNFSGGGRGRGGGFFDTPSSHLWVANLPPDISESYLNDLFGKHGLLDGITLYAARGYSFVYYKRVEDAAAAKNELQGFLINGNPLKIQFAKLAKPSKHLWVGGFGSSVTKERLEEEFSKFGKIEEFRFVRERNTALVDFVRLEDATAAVKNLNRFRIGEDRIRVDFLRSHPMRREQSDFPDQESAQFRGVGAVDIPWSNPDAMRSYPDHPPYPGHQRPQTPQSSGGRKDNVPSKVLWVGYPSSVIVDEDMLHNAMILFGEIERVTCFRDRHYSFVEFRSVEEARRAKEALQGRLFNDPRITITYSNSEQAPGKDYGPPYSGFGGQRPGMLGNELPFRPPLMDMFPPNHGMAPNNFHGPLPPNAMLGPGVPRPLGPRGGFEPLLPPSDFNDPTTHSSMPDLAANISLGFNRRKLSPPAPGLLPTQGRTSKKTTGWDVVDPNQPPRALKRSRVDDQTSYPSPTIKTGDKYVAGVDQPYGGGPQASSGHLPRVLADSGSNSAPDTRVGKGQVTRPKEDCVWRGVISKGGTPVCNARCIAIGKGLECELPEAVNCSARTGLDMLTKHCASAIGFDIVFFLPDSEEDFANYTEFLRYLGSKNRAGVAKLDDGTTLFLVPPSDFLADVLKVPGRERLYGLVLKLPQQGDQPLPPPVAQMNRQLAAPPHAYVIPEKDQVPAQIEYRRTIPNETAPPKAPEHNNNGVSSTSLPGVTLTPELIATLASFLPKNSQAPAPAPQTSQPQLSSSSTGFSHPVFPTNEKPVFSQGWNSQQQPQVVDQTMQQSHQQFNSQMYPVPQVQMSTTLQSISSNFNPNMPMQNPMYYNQATPQSSQQFVQSSQPYNNFEPPHYTNQQGYGMVYGDNNQQPNNSGQYNFYGANSSVSENVLPNSSGNMIVQPQNQTEVSQPEPSGANQSTEVEGVKNQRYQTTLQFAADLLLQIQQRQQQQQASSQMGNQQ